MSASKRRAAEILLEADVERITVGRVVRWVSHSYFLRNAVHLALAREAVWSAYHTEVRRWPLAAFERVEPRTEPAADRKAADLAEAEGVRRSHRDTEASVLLIGRLHFIVLLLVLTVMALIVSLVVLGPPGDRTQPSLIAISVLSTLGAWLVTVSRGLRKLQPWAASGNPCRVVRGAGSGGRASGRVARTLRLPNVLGSDSSGWAWC